MFCPMTREECKNDCAWFVEGECCICNINRIETDLDYLQDAVSALEETIKAKSFTEQEGKGSRS